MPDALKSRRTSIEHRNGLKSLLTKIQCGYETARNNESMKYNEFETMLICIVDGGALRKCELYDPCFGDLTRLRGSERKWKECFEF